MTRAELSGFKNAVYGQLMYILLKQEVCKEKPESSNQKENPQPKKTKKSYALLCQKNFTISHTS